MNPITPACFNEICADPAVRERLGSLDASRREALRSFWLWTAAGLVVGLAAFFWMLQSGWQGLAALAIFIPIAAVIAGYRGLTTVSEALKQPVLAALAAKAGLDYLENGFSPPVYPEAEKLLFGRLTSRDFTDLLHGRDPEGKGIALYEADLVRGSGKNRHIVFKGQVYAVERDKPGGTTIIVPDRGLFNFLKPSGMERVRLESDPEFEKKFEIYATGEMEARQLLFDSAFRARLLELRRLGRVFLFAGPDGALLAVSTRRDRFEPGSMFSGRSADERVRAMVEDVCDALASLREVKARLG